MVNVRQAAEQQSLKAVVEEELTMGLKVSEACGFEVEVGIGML